MLCSMSFSTNTLTNIASLSLICYILFIDLSYKRHALSLKPKRLRYPFDIESFKHAIIIHLSSAFQEV